MKKYIMLILAIIMVSPFTAFGSMATCEIEKVQAGHRHPGPSNHFYKLYLTYPDGTAVAVATSRSKSALENEAGMHMANGVCTY